MSDSGWQDPYCYPGTRVLRNKFSEQDPARFTVIERELTRAAMLRLDRSPEPGTFDMDHLCAIHNRIFGNIFSWAGQPRTIDISKDSTHFMPHTLLTPAAGYLFGTIRQQNFLQDMERDEFVLTISEHFANLNHLHPFREGNGRTQRAFLHQLARQSGWNIAWDRMDPKDNLQASILSNVNPKTPRLREFLDPLVEPVNRSAGIPRRTRKSASSGLTLDIFRRSERVRDKSRESRRNAELKGNTPDDSPRQSDPNQPEYRRRRSLRPDQ